MSSDYDYYKKYKKYKQKCKMMGGASGEQLPTTWEEYKHIWWPNERKRLKEDFKKAEQAENKLLFDENARKKNSNYFTDLAAKGKATKVARQKYIAFEKHKKILRG